MAYGNFDVFRPSESAYVNPGEYETVQRNIALEKASYLTTMDQFYADLEERGREFDLTLGLEEKKLSETTREFDVGLKESSEQYYFGKAQEKNLAEQSLEFEQSKESFFESSWLQEFAENMRQFNKQADLKQQEINLGGRAAQSSERNDLMGNIFGGIGLIDTISDWF